MLILSHTASTVIRRLVVASGADVPDDAGLRITGAADGQQPLSIAAVEGPQATDEVVEHEGARVFLDATVAAVLDDKVLDARIDGDGGVQFLLALQ
jgi:Fe-S cluster assembly iron-binding protein IscA